MISWLELHFSDDKSNCQLSSCSTAVMQTHCLRKLQIELSSKRRKGETEECTGHQCTARNQPFTRLCTIGNNWQPGAQPLQISNKHAPQQWVKLNRNFKSVLRSSTALIHLICWLKKEEEKKEEKEKKRKGNDATTTQRNGRSVASEGEGKHKEGQM